jgi:hypothetical protein
MNEAEEMDLTRRIVFVFREGWGTVGKWRARRVVVGGGGYGSVSGGGGGGL